MEYIFIVQVNFIFTEIETKVKNGVDGLSVERLTLLGRVHMARVIVDKLILQGFDLNSSISRTKKKGQRVGRPPKPSPKLPNKNVYVSFIN